MPVIAESEPLPFGETPETPPEQPPVTPTPQGPPTSIVVIPPGMCNLADIIENHKVFIGHVDLLGSCFGRESMPEFSDADFEFHKNLAIIDKYLVENNNNYCSMQAVTDLSQKLKRFQDE